MSTINDGGFAFPSPEWSDAHGNISPQEYGMSLRDYFAAQFMARAQSLCEDRGGWSMQDAAQCAYDMADAMLKAREQSGGAQ